MNLLLLAALVFLLGHMGISSTPLRPLLQRLLGARVYQGLYSVGAAAATWWLVSTYLAAPKEVLWQAGPALRGLAALLMPLALLGVVAGVSSPSPTSAGQALRPGEAEPARGLLRVTRHPLMWAIALWAVTHMLANGDAASQVFFGAFAVLALGGAALQERRKAVEQAAEWPRFVAVTSFVPFAALLAGRNRFVWREVGWVRLGVALAVYAVLMAGGHLWLFGVRPY